ncbi:MAG: ExeM/NucH family extracellular endonuclease [Rubripirellula sp.]|nr:ExeM/NucH family extracellular endonuclease [Rubripirellula sp.]
MNDAAIVLASFEQQSNGGDVVITGDLNSVDWQSYLGKQVVIEGDLVIVDTYDLARRGQITVARDRLYVPTSQIDPNDADPNETSFEGGSNVAKVTAAQKQNDGATIIIDDGNSAQNVFPPPLFPELAKTYPTVRVGSVIQGVSGRLVEERNKLVLRSDEPLRWLPSPRPERPDVGDADVIVASFNVLNYFTTIDNGQNKARGADSVSELNRQEAKIVSAIVGLQADVVGLMEMENNLDAENRLVAALNKKLGKNVYKGCGIPNGFGDSPGGSDAIRVGIIYRADRVLPVGDVLMIDDNAFFVARTPIVQTFRSVEGGDPLTVIVNHFKSKGGASNANAANKNKGDGQAAYNAARRSQSRAICDYIQKRSPNARQSRVLVIGDLNAYQQEDPIDMLRANGLVDLLEQSETSGSLESSVLDYSFVYYGQCGSLDHAFASESLARDVTGIATWHINADEPRFMDYNEEFNPKPLYSADPYRSSDHDPVLIGIRN